MKTKGFLVVGKNGSLKAVKNIRGSLDPDSIAIAINLSIPDSAFKPIITAEISIAEKDIHPVMISGGKFKAMEDLLTNELGLQVKLMTIEQVKGDKNDKR